MLRTERGGVFVNKIPFRSVVLFLFFLVVTASSTFLCAQMVTIKLVNGRNGHPMSNSHVNVWVGPKSKRTMVIPTNIDGIARIRLTDNDEEVDLHIRKSSEGGDVVIDPIVKYDDNIRVNVPFVICYPRVRDYSWLAITNISTTQLLQQGIVWPNSCGKATEESIPGELIIFVRPLSWWETLKQ